MNRFGDQKAVGLNMQPPMDLDTLLPTASVVAYEL